MSEQHQVAAMANEIALLGMTTKVAISGVFGAAIGSILGEGTWWERLARGFTGLAVCYAGYDVTAQLVRGTLSIVLPKDHLPSVSDFHPATALLCGVVGMILCQAMIKFLSAVRDAAPEYVADKLGGDDHDHDHDRTETGGQKA